MVFITKNMGKKEANASFLIDGDNYEERGWKGGLEPFPLSLYSAIGGFIR